LKSRGFARISNAVNLNRIARVNAAIGQAAMRKSSSSSTSGGDLMLCGVFVALSILAGALVVTFILVVTSPIVSVFPADSGASEIVTGVAMLWGVVTGCVVAVSTIGPWRRLHSRAQVESFDEANAVPLELVGRPVPPRRVANDDRARHAAAQRLAAPGYAFEDDDDALLLEDEAEMPRRRAASGPRYRRAS
jgi:hypothetical protein